MAKRKLSTIIAIVIIFSLLLSLGVSAIEYPDGTTVYNYDAQGTDKEISTTLVDSSGSTLKVLDMYGPAGEYFTSGLTMWGYDAVSSDFPWHAMVSAEMTSMSGSTSYNGGRSYYTQVGCKFTKLLSPDTYNATVAFAPHTCVANVKHITVDQYGNESVYSSSTLNLTYDSSFSTSSKYISNHTLNADYRSSISKTFTWDLLGSMPNMPEGSYTSRYHSPTWEDIETSYHDEREIDIVFKYTLNHYTVEYNANGGSNAPASQTKWYGVGLVMTEAEPTREGYRFLGWSTSRSATYAAYYPGDTYTANRANCFFAVWEDIPEPEVPDVTPPIVTPPAADTYTVSYNANGGSGAPSSQTKTQGKDLTVSYTEPSRSGYTFLGWTQYSWSTTVYYYPGDTYSSDADITLYAVWQEIPSEPDPVVPEPEDPANYEFSISYLTVPTEAEINSTLSFSVRTDNWDEVNAYSEIPVELLYDGEVIETQYVDFSVYGLEYVYFNVDVGGDVGSHTITARINWPFRYSETNPYNNDISGTVEVMSNTRELSVEGIVPNASYRENTTVISGFRVYNEGSTDVLPGENCTVSFAAYYYLGVSKIILSSQTWDNFVIPAGDSNLVYFTWDVPFGLGGNTIYCEATVISREADQDESNNTDAYSVVVVEALASQPDNTYYENAPSAFGIVEAPAERNEISGWEQWVYENDRLVLKAYRAQISCSLAFEPHNSVTSAEWKNGKWLIKSGYGVTLELSPDIVSGASAFSYTNVQSAYVTFPEFKYSSANGYYATLENYAGTFSFVESPYSNTSASVHFLPVWYPDGSYTVSITLSDCWTPSGMITCVINAEIMVSGTMYDDFYVGG